MNVRLIRPGLGSVRSLPRAVAHRWPALAVATLAVAVPMSVALADQLSNTTIVALQNTGPALEVDQNSNGFAVEVNNFSPTNPNFGEGIRVVSDADGIDVESGIGSASANGRAIKARGGSEGVIAEGGNTSSLGGIEAIGVGVAAGGEHIGVKTAGGDTGVSATSQFGVGVSADGQTGVIASGASGPGVKATSSNGAGVDATSSNGDGVVGTGHGQFGTGVLGSGDDVGVQGNGINVGVDGNSPNGDAMSGFSSIGGTGVFGQSVNGLGAEFKGGEAPLRLDPATTAGAPTSGTHKRGELYVDSKGQLFLCVADSVNGNPGTWKQVVLK